jgi:hypothetical protein
MPAALGRINGNPIGFFWIFFFLETLFFADILQPLSLPSFQPDGGPDREKQAVS